MTSQSMASGDPWCEVHGFNPCQCWYYRQFASPIQPSFLMQTVSQNNFPLCSGCGKHQGTCVCGGSSDPWADITSVRSKTSVDITVPVDNTPPKKWADELRDEAKRVLAAPPLEPKSLYIYLLERCKWASKAGEFVTNFWGSRLRVWNKEEIEMAADLLRADNFKVDVTLVDGDLLICVSWQ